MQKQIIIKEQNKKDVRSMISQEEIIFHQKEDSDSDNQNQYDQNVLKKIKIQTVEVKDPHQYLNLAKNHKKFKIMDQCNPILSNVYLKDISLQYKGPMQDKKYSSSDLFYENIRRGNTLCQIYNEKQQQVDLFFCRRGMKKFFDLQPQYFEINKHLTHQHQLYRKRIFQKIDKFQPGSKIHLYSIFKQNGEHCQVTYIKKLDYWLIGSKNVSILVKTQEDLQKYYQKQRFYWAKLIAKEFLSVLKSMSQQHIQSLKDQLDSKTLLGQHCGNTQHQHITKYEKVQIIYYCIVEKTGSDHCLSVDYCKKFLQKYGFKMSKSKEIKNIQDKNQIYKSMYELLKQTAEGTMDQYGQGNVLYVVQQKNQVQRTISMCKLKTSQYLIFRRMRQMLKLNVAKKGMTANSYEKFKFDIEQMVQKYFKPPKQIRYYFQMAKQAFKQAHKDKQITQTYLRYKFAQFLQKFLNQQQNKQQNQSLGKLMFKRFIIVCLPRLSNSLQKYAKLNNFNIEYMYRAPMKQNQNQKSLQKSTAHILYMIPRLGNQNMKNTEIIIYRYNENQIQKIIEEIQEFKDLSKSQLITFVKSQDKKKNILMLKQKIKQFQEVLTKKQVKYWIVDQAQQDKDKKCTEIIQKCSRLKKSDLKDIEEEEQDKPVKKEKIFVIYPFILPGGGKSTLNKQLTQLSKEEKFQYITIESDKLRRQVMESFADEKNSQIDLDDHGESGNLFLKSKQKTLQLYQQKLLQSLYIKTQKTKIIFLDKVFAPNILSRQIQRVQDLLTPTQQIFPIILLPNSQPLQFKNYSLPFSLRYILICLKRCLQREGHQTLTTRPHRIANVLLSYVQFYKKFNQSKLQNIVSKLVKQFQVIKINTIIEKDNVVNLNIKNKLQECLDLCQSQELKESACFVQLIEMLYKNLSYVQDVAINNQLFIGEQIWSKLIETISKFTQ